MEMNVGGAAMHRFAARHVLIPVVQMHPSAVQQKLQLFAGDLAERGVVVHQPFVDGENFEHVVAIRWKLVLHHQSTTRAEWKAFNVIILTGVGRHAIDGERRLTHITHGDAADFGCSRGVAFQQRG